MENDPTVLIWCEWEESGYHDLKTAWTPRGNKGRNSGLQGGYLSEVGAEKIQAVGISPAQVSYKGQGRGQLQEGGCRRLLSSENKE